MGRKPVLLVYTVPWSEKRNLLFSRYLSNYFEVIILTIFNEYENILEIIKPVRVIPDKFWLKNKVGLSFLQILKNI